MPQKQDLAGPKKIINPAASQHLRKTMERSTMFSGKIHYFYGHFQVRKLLVYQRVFPCSIFSVDVREHVTTLSQNVISQESSRPAFFQDRCPTWTPPIVCAEATKLYHQQWIGETSHTLWYI